MVVGVVDVSLGVSSPLCRHTREDSRSVGAMVRSRLMCSGVHSKPRIKLARGVRRYVITYNGFFSLSLVISSDANQRSTYHDVGAGLSVSSSAKRRTVDI